jgi:hypothetical protein
MSPSQVLLSPLTAYFELGSADFESRSHLQVPSLSTSALTNDLKSKSVIQKLSDKGKADFTPRIVGKSLNTFEGGRSGFEIDSLSVYLLHELPLDH